MSRKSPIDRRVVRTRATLQHALNSLILKKRYEVITIKEICDAADVGRSTFYAHYTSKDDLKRKGFERLRGLLTDRQRQALAMPTDAGHRNFAFSLAMFEHARDHRHHYRALVGGRGGIVSLGTIRQILSDLVHRELAETSRKGTSDAVPRELAVQYIVGAFMAVMTWWLDGGAKLSPERIDAVFRRLALQGLPRSHRL
jgi:AcrR family transcriptional regulator